ncbi:hypothetical protein HW532_18430 [Kaustia mangrovi]|uniref:DUF465 domain-containing protein n=1 Tax=Kaustia mangrovi TaxID=2593653 RepID=A0A7S8C6V9_9HYPH|nr:hypothetical protein [Kaustia mangrovi]QPC44498.1 hypothetical protein HW532_18430 [Kaustia mangrovi]
MAGTSARAEALPLLHWEDLADIERLRSERDAICARMARLPLHSHRRVVLQARLSELTARQLQLELKVGGAS